MPRHKEVPTLLNLAVKSVGSVVVEMAPHIISTIEIHRDPQNLLLNLQNSLGWINNLLASHVPCYLYDQMAIEVLTSVKALIENTKKLYCPNSSISQFLTEMNVVVSLTEVVMNPKLRSLNFSDWPKIMRYVLYKNLVKLSGLEYLNLGSCSGTWRTNEYDKCVVDGISSMKNLRQLCLCFDGSDIVVQTVSENCPHIQIIDVTASRSVTDRSVASLLKCTELRELNLNRTSITIDGVARLIIGLERLQDLGRCDGFGAVVEHLQANFGNIGPFALKKLQLRDLMNCTLRLMAAMFPKVEYVSLFTHSQYTDLSALVEFENLKELKLLSSAYYADCLRRVLEVRGAQLQSLHLEHVEEMDLNVLLDISHFCPQLKSLVLYNCDFTDNHSNVVPWLKNKPFCNLEKIFWVVDGATRHLEFILRNAVNVNYIHLGTSTGITHSTIVNVLSVNPMRRLEELRVLYSTDMSMSTVELLLASCTSLKILSELESWQAITLDELYGFKKVMQNSNFDLDIRPTLSYY